MYSSSSEMLSYWPLCKPANSDHLFLWWEEERWASYMQSSWVNFLLLRAGPWHASGLIGDPTGTLTTCYIALYPVAGLTGVAKLPEGFLTKYTWLVCVHQMSMAGVLQQHLVFPQMVSHPSTNLGPRCLTSVIWTANWYVQRGNSCSLFYKLE